MSTRTLGPENLRKSGLADLVYDAYISPPPPLQPPPRLDQKQNYFDGAQSATPVVFSLLSSLPPRLKTFKPAYLPSNP